MTSESEQLKQWGTIMFALIIIYAMSSCERGENYREIKEIKSILLNSK